jgi:hypothetical protein
MLTNKGKNILAKYLIGQAPAYASYIAFGCGPSAIDSNTGSFGDYSGKTSLDFEMFRSPIVSRGYVTDTEQASIVSAVGNGTIITYTSANAFTTNDVVDIVGVDTPGFNFNSAVITSSSDSEFTVASSVVASALGGTATRTLSSIVLTAQLPTDERYEVTEIGVYSAGSNPTAGPSDSRLLYSFDDNENWEYHDATGASTLTKFNEDLSKLIDGTVPDGASLEAINVPDLAFSANADNPILDKTIRINRNERSRFLNNTVFLRGDSSAITGSGSSTIPSVVDGAHTHLNGITLNLDKNSGQDEIRLAFSVVNKSLNASNPSQVDMIIDFVSSDDIYGINQQYARMRVSKNSVNDDFNNNRYFVASSKIEDLEKSQEFSWRNVTAIKIYASIPTPDLEVASKEVTDGIATLTFAVVHDFNVGGRVTISGVGSAGTSDASLNGLHKIKAVTANSISYVTELSDLATTTLAPAGNASGQSSSYYVALDAIRLENTTTSNPLYGLVGYTVPKTVDASPIVKEANTSSLLEFRFAMDVI